MSVRIKLTFLPFMYVFLISCSNFSTSDNKNKVRSLNTTDLYSHLLGEINKGVDRIIGSIPQTKNQANLQKKPSLLEEDNQSENLNWYLRIFKIALVEAEKLDEIAMYHMGLLYKEGFHQDENQAIYWLEKSAEKNYPPASYHLGMMYFEKDDHGRALYWLQKSSSLNYRRGSDMIKRLFDTKKDLSDSDFNSY